jgi:3-phosphoshikimate 1-carboxyvinyltransferase
MIPLAALSGNEMTMTVSDRLMQRPLSVYEDIFRREKIRLEKDCRNDVNRITVEGAPNGGTYNMDGSISSQFISGMLFALPLVNRCSMINLIPPVESRPYIDMTISALGTFGITAEWERNSRGDAAISIPGGQTCRPPDVRVEGDWSNAAFLLAMGYDVTGLRHDSLQGDKICVDYFRALEEGCAELDISSCPDLGPVLMAYAALHNGCRLTGTRRLSIKESDRGSAMKKELAKFGVNVEISDNSIVVGNGVSTPKDVLYGHNDHRIVMALAVICVQTGGAIDGAQAVNKSFPDFFDRLSETGTKIIRSDI